MINNFQKIVEGAPDPIFIQCKMKFSYLNPAACELFGIKTPDELIGKPVMDRFHPNYHKLIKERIKLLNEKKSSVSEKLEQRFLRIDGSEVWVETTGVPIVYEGENGALVFVRNISKRKNAEKALQKSELKFYQLVEIAPVSIIISDHKGKILYANRKFNELFGYTTDDVSTVKEWLLLAFPDEHYREKIKEKWITGVEKTANMQTDIEPAEYEVTCKTGSIRHIEFQMAIAGELNFLILIDITKRKMAEIEKEKLSEQLIQAQKMESVGRLAGGVAHDFNNMLSVIIGYSEVVMSGLGIKNEFYQNLKEILDAANRSADITKQLLAFARKQTIAPEVLDLNSNIEKILKMLQRLIGEDIDLAWKPEIGLWPVKLDPIQVDQIMANLCVNARDAIIGIGKVTIETHNVTFNEAYCADHLDFFPGDYIMLAVSDDGCGIDKETLPFIFEPFYTTKNLGEGTGLGLSTVYGIVKQNNGFINVYSEPEKGTTFRIYLSRYMGLLGNKTADDLNFIHGGNGEIILLVEDEKAIRILAKKMLEKLNYQVILASSPGEALWKAEKQVDKIHLLLTDVVMPDMSGRDLAKQLKTLYPNIKILFMSGYTSNVIAHRGVLDDGVNFIPKPFSQRDLALKVYKALSDNQNITCV